MYLGHIVGGGQVRPEKSKVAAIESFPLPTTKKHVHVFWGMKNYYRRFIPNYASLAAPLTDLTQKAAPKQVEWTIQWHQAF